jgi:uncharacterized delta-60 repeat protein
MDNHRVRHVAVGTLHARLTTILAAVLILVSASSSGVQAANEHIPGRMNLADVTIHLPLVMNAFRSALDAPVLNAIDNTDGDGNFTVTWSSSPEADTYLLQVDNNAEFSSPVTAYSGAGTSTDISAKDVGTYYYRSQAANTSVSSGWSNVVSAVVSVPLPACPQAGAWFGINSSGQAISFIVENTPACRIADDSLKITIYILDCPTRTTTYSPGLIVNNHFSAGTNPHVEGDFTSSTTSSGTFSVSFPHPTAGYTCSRSGTWKATVNGANDIVRALAVQADGKIVVGGLFTTLGGQPHSRIGRVNADGSLDESFNPQASGYLGNVYALAIQADGKILVGGNFNALGEPAISKLARLNTDGSVDSTFNPGVSGEIYTLAVQEDGKILAGGLFTTVGGQTRNRIVRLNSDGTLDTDFNPGANNRVYALLIQKDGRILVGGAFTTLAGVTRNRIGRLNADGSLDTTFNPGANGDIKAFALQEDGKILVGGAFSALGGQTRRLIALLNTDGTLDATFNPGATSNEVTALLVQPDGRIVVGGLFSVLSGVNRPYLGRLNSDGTYDATFPVTNGQVFALVAQTDGKLLAGGDFESLAGEPRYYIGRLNADGTLDTTYAPFP